METATHKPPRDGAVVLVDDDQEVLDIVPKWFANHDSRIVERLVTIRYLDEAQRYIESHDVATIILDLNLRARDEKESVTTRDYAGDTLGRQLPHISPFGTPEVVIYSESEGSDDVMREGNTAWRMNAFASVRKYDGEGKRNADDPSSGESTTMAKLYSAVTSANFAHAFDAAFKSSYQWFEKLNADALASGATLWFEFLKQCFRAQLVQQRLLNFSDYSLVRIADGDIQFSGTMHPSKDSAGALLERIQRFREVGNSEHDPLSFKELGIQFTRQGGGDVIQMYDGDIVPLPAHDNERIVLFPLLPQYMERGEPEKISTSEYKIFTSTCEHLRDRVALRIGAHWPEVEAVASAYRTGYRNAVSTMGIEFGRVQETLLSRVEEQQAEDLHHIAADMAAREFSELGLLLGDYRLRSPEEGAIWIGSPPPTMAAEFRGLGELFEAFECIAEGVNDAFAPPPLATAIEQILRWLKMESKKSPGQSISVVMETREPPGEISLKFRGLPRVPGEQIRRRFEPWGSITPDYGGPDGTSVTSELRVGLSLFLARCIIQLEIRGQVLLSTDGKREDQHILELRIPIRSRHEDADDIAVRESGG